MSKNNIKKIRLTSDNYFNGANRNRTCDIVLAKHALFQLSYSPVAKDTSNKWAWIDLNYRPLPYQRSALTN